MTRYIRARFDSVCAETGQTIPKGSRCLYRARERAVYAIGSLSERWHRVMTA
jgi:hypothetical protein